MSGGAETTYTAINGGDVSFDKYLVLKNEATVPNVSFNFTVASIEDSEGYDAEFKLGEDAADHVNTKTFTLNENTELNVTNTLNGILPTGINANFLAVAAVLLSGKL